jgi:hypothetical protein
LFPKQAKGLTLIIVVLLTIGIISTLFFLKVPLGEPRLRVEFYPSPPWQMKPGESLELTIGIANDGWLLAWAKNIHVTVSMPEGFINSRTDMNECELDFFTLYGGDGMGNGLTIAVSNSVKPGNYTIIIKVSGENIQEKTFSPKVTVAT